ncbi:hypothetical protein H6F78_24875 [Coleofasciculus sp. FACHB-64]|uniref:hypothetical protein n=1 Tax=Cyanophyceae TaxID=3028117 RepID=UPI001684E8B7|nr:MULTISPECIES: hypothetical protein [unclassified Coleofasciculus]MBD1838726.1 hypothetical protein [Coleofasciculus sp. FACHB-501]MBD2048792.1 hypothetical protein [Coleofasciculus sp. FACHB-64]
MLASTLPTPQSAGVIAVRAIAFCLMSAIASLLTPQACFLSPLFGWLQTVRM